MHKNRRAVGRRLPMGLRALYMERFIHWEVCYG